MDSLVAQLEGSAKTEELELDQLTPVQLWNIIITLQRACGRSTGGRREARRKYFCLAGQFFNTASQLRGLPTPKPGDSYGAMKHDPDYGKV